MGNNLWLKQQRERTAKDGKFVISLEESLQKPYKPPFWTPGSGPTGNPAGIIIPGATKRAYAPNDVFKSGNKDFLPWVVALQVQLDGTESNWEDAIWFVLAPDPDEATRRANHWWTRYHTLAWRASGNTGPIPPWPDTNGNAECMGLDMDDWNEFYEASVRRCHASSRFVMRREGNVLVSVGKESARRDVKMPLFWALIEDGRYHALDFRSIVPTSGVSDTMPINSQ